MEIPAGLICENAEFFGIRKIGVMFNYIITGGKTIPFVQSPDNILSAVDNTMTAQDHECLDAMGINDLSLRRDQWITCNGSHLDHHPDFTRGSSTVSREFVYCPNRNTCPYQGKLCRTLPQLTGLTPTEILILSDIYLGLLDKEIAHKRRMQYSTVKTHNKNIRIKTGLSRKVDLVRYAQKLNLIQHV